MPSACEQLVLGRPPDEGGMPTYRGPIASSSLKATRPSFKPPAAHCKDAVRHELPSLLQATKLLNLRAATTPQGAAGPLRQGPTHPASPSLCFPNAAARSAAAAKGLAMEAPGLAAWWPPLHWAAGSWHSAAGLLPQPGTAFLFARLLPALLPGAACRLAHALPLPRPGAACVSAQPLPPPLLPVLNK